MLKFYEYIKRETALETTRIMFQPQGACAVILHT